MNATSTAASGARMHDVNAETRAIVDLVLLDYKLPDIDGVTVLRQIKEYDPDIVVILLTAYATVTSATALGNHGISG